MIPFDFEYHRPETLEEARACYWGLMKANQHPVWYAGGTELISMARVGTRTFGAVVDLKDVPECTRMGIALGRLYLGSAITLTQLADSALFPLLGRAAARIADHTIQGKITLGGNLAGTIKYREAALPLLLCGTKAQILTEKGLEERPFAQIFAGRLLLDDGACLISVSLPEEEATLPCCHTKRTRQDKIDYPLVSLCAHRAGSVLHAAVTGYGDGPIVLPSPILSDRAMTPAQRAARVLSEVSAQGRADLSGSLAYKNFVFKNVVAQAVSNLEGVRE